MQGNFFFEAQAILISGVSFVQKSMESNIHVYVKFSQMEFSSHLFFVPLLPLYSPLAVALCFLLIRIFVNAPLPPKKVNVPRRARLLGF